MNQTNDNHDQDSLYFEDTKDTSRGLDKEIDKLKSKQEALRKLDEKVSEIDCNRGCASIEITKQPHDTIIHVNTATPDLCPEVKSLLQDYSWEGKFKIGYDSRNQLVTWSLKTTLAMLTESHNQRLHS